MNAHRRMLALAALTVLLLLTASEQALAQASAPGGPAARAPADDLSGVRAIAVEALQFARRGELSRARERVEVLEVRWRQVEPTTRAASPQRWKAIDGAIDRVERELRFWRVRSTDSAAALQTLIDVIDQSG